MKFPIGESLADPEFGMSCQRLLPWRAQAEEPPFGVMACFLPGGSSSAPDCHDQDEVMIVLAGSGSVQVDDESVGIAAGDVVAIDRNRVHVVVNPTTVTLSWVSFYWPLHEPAGPPPGPGTEEERR